MPFYTLVDKVSNQEFEVTNYSPTIDKPVNEGKPIKSEKEFEREVADLAVKLKDTQTADWKVRTAALKRIQYFAQFYKESGVAQGTSVVTFAKFYDSIRKLTDALSAQVLDLRSATAKEAGLAI